MTDPDAPAGTPSRPFRDVDWIPVYLVVLLLVLFLLVIAAVGQQRPGAAAAGPVPTAPATALDLDALGPVTGNNLPGGITRIFGDDRLLVGYSGTAGTGALGVLGEGSPDEVVPRLSKAAAAFTSSGRPVQPVFELVVTVAHAGPTASGEYSTDLDRATVQSYLDAAHRFGVLVVLELQPGRADFLEVAQRWEWALRDPLVGLGLDPEYRMGPDQVPGEQIGSVSAEEVDEVTAWLEELTVERGLPEKLLVLQQFRGDMIRDLGGLARREHLAMVQSIDGFGSPRAKISAYDSLVRPEQLTPGFRIFHDEDDPRMQPSEVLRLDPRVSYVSYR